MFRLIGSTVVLAVVASSCVTMPPPPVQFVAEPTDALALNGAWEGQYYSAETQRYGSIRFLLSARGDSAFGDVLMLTKRTSHGRAADETRMMTAGVESQTVSIGFVVARGGSVSGLMTPYEDAEGAVLLTRFDGVLRDDSIRGRYVTHNLETLAVTSGDWSVQRKKP